MRLELILTPLEKRCTIPINYQYPLSGAIYQILATGSPQYADWLHNHGYTTPEGRHMKLFVFSRLFIGSMKPKGKTLIAHDFKPCKLYISSPMLEHFVQSFVTGIFKKRQIAIGNQYTVGHFEISHVTALCQPQWQESGGICPPTRFLCLSPIVLSNKGNHNYPSRVPHYIRPEEPEFPEAIRQNLLQKFMILHGHLPANEDLSFSWDQDYIQHRGGYHKISKLITIQEGNRERETKIKSFLAPFYLVGSMELLHTAYECGIGEKNSLGFGMIGER
jgi:CRISPR-associated endoribonuclease Cas6